MEHLMMQHFTAQLTLFDNLHFSLNTIILIFIHSFWRLIYM